MKVSGQFSDFLLSTMLPAFDVEIKKTFTHKRYGVTLPSGPPRPLTEEEHAERARQEWLATQPIQGCEANPLRILQARADRARVSIPSCANCESYSEWQECLMRTDYYEEPHHVCGDWEHES